MLVIYSVSEQIFTEHLLWTNSDLEKYAAGRRGHGSPQNFLKDRWGLALGQLGKAPFERRQTLGDEIDRKSVV